MSCKIFAQLYEFLCEPEVTALYSSIRKLQRPKLEEALRIRGLSSTCDDDVESLLRVRLLRFEVQFYHPEIRVPDCRLSEEDVVAMRAKADAMCDLARTLSCEGAHAVPEDSREEQTVPSAIGVKTPSDSTDATSESQVKHRLNCVNLLRVCKLQYSGARGLPAQDFLEQLDDFRRFSKIEERVLLEILPFALDSSTRKWYRASNFPDWPAFERKFVEDHVSEAPKRRETRPLGPRTPPGSPKLRAPVSKTLRELRDSLLDIGLRGADTPADSRRTSVASENSSVASNGSPTEATHLSNDLLSTADRKDTEKTKHAAPRNFDPTVGAARQIRRRDEQTNNASSTLAPNANSYYGTGSANSNRDCNATMNNYACGMYRYANPCYFPSYARY